MKVYFLADTHLGMKGDNEIWLDDCYNYYNNFLLPHLRKVVKKDDILVHLGDVFDNRAQIGLHTINVAIDLFEQLSDIFSDIRICIGNHDIWQKHSTKITSVNVLKYIKNVKIYYTPTFENIGTKSILFMPWVEDIDEQRKTLKFYDNADYIFGHLEVSGSLTNMKGTKFNSDKSLNSNDFKNAQVYAGHIHIKQNFKNVHYVGTPYHKDRGDIGDTKGITVLDIESGKTKFIENTYSPKYIRVSIYDILDKTVEEIKEEWRNNYVDFVVKGVDIMSCNFEPLRDVMKDYYKEFNLVADNTETIVTHDNINISETKSSKDMLYDYIEQIHVDDSMRIDIKDKVEKIMEKIKV